jgi:hypothetical protein
LLLVKTTVIVTIVVIAIVIEQKSATAKITDGKTAAGKIVQSVSPGFAMRAVKI